MQSCSREACRKTQQKKRAVKIEVDNKLRGAFGETDLNKGLIRINKKRHFDPRYKMVNPTGDPYKDLASTVNHELLHVKHPKASEKAVRKMERTQAHRMTKKRKAELLAKLR